MVPDDLIKTCREAMPDMRMSDRAGTGALLERFLRRSAEGLAADRLAERLNVMLETAKRRSLRGVPESLKLELPSALPVSAMSERIIAGIREHQVLIVCGTTGSGKTTQLPKMAMLAGRGREGMIGCTQPRRIAALSMADRVAEECACVTGKEIGYKVRFDDSTSERTVLKFMTDGILLAETQNDHLLLEYDTIIIDEAHERSLNIDFILGYLKNLLPSRPDLKVLISSATLDAERFSEFFGNAPVVTVEGRTYPVEEMFLPPEEDEDLPGQVLRAVKWIGEVDRKGDILVFLPGEREITEAMEVLNGQMWNDTEVLPLFARLNVSEQRRIFHPGRFRRIILSTNVAETSITIPRIHYVIDSGLVRMSRFNPGNQVEELKIEQVSKASARQRRGRCGRLSEGICVYLYDREIFDASPEFTDPEIRRSSLAGVILRMAALGLPPLEDFPLIDPPQSALVREGYRTLQHLRALDAKRRITAFGRELAELPLDPHLAAMVCHARKGNVCGEVLVIASFLSIMDVRERPAERRQAADQAHGQWNDERSDFVSIINLWNFIRGDAGADRSYGQLRKLCTRNFLNFKRVREWSNLFNELCERINSLGWRLRTNPGKVFEDVNYDLLHRALLAGIPTHIAMRDVDGGCYRGAGNRRFQIFPGSGLFRKTPEWILSFELVETKRLYARKVAEIDPVWVEEVAGHLCKRTYDNVRWNRSRGFVSARETVISSGLVVNSGRTVHYGKVMPAEAREIFIRDAMVPGDIDSKGRWLDLHRAMLDNIALMEVKLRRPGGLLDNEAIYAHFDRVLPEGICSTLELDEWIAAKRARIAMRLEDAVFEETSLPGLTDYPDSVEYFGTVFELIYTFDPGEAGDGVTLRCPESELGLLPEHCCEWIVPGLLPEKVRLLLRTLPKESRTRVNPLEERAGEFCQAVSEGRILKEQPLTQALGIFLSESMGISVSTRDFSPERLPDHMTMNIAVIGEAGRVLRLSRGMPERSGAGTRLGAVHKGAAEWTVPGGKCWPPTGRIPMEIELDGGSGVKGYPALSPLDDGVGVEVFLDCHEANWSHGRGLVKLYKLACGDHIKYLKRNLPLPDSVKLTMCLKDRAAAFMEDYLDAGIFASLTNDGEFDIRDPDFWERRVADTRERLLWEFLVYHTSLLEGFAADLERIEDMLARVSNKAHYVASIMDVREQLEFLFRKGFLRERNVFSSYPRYLKALRLRVERMLLNPAKDEAKMSAVDYFQERFRIAMGAVGDYEKAFSLKEFGVLLQEFRIAQFAPEARCSVKVSEKIMSQAWDEVRY